MFEYEVVPVALIAGAGGELEPDWAALRAALNRRAAEGFRVVAVSDGEHGSAVLMEREGRGERSDVVAVAEVESVAEAAEEITRRSAREEAGER
jgi:hypothetical protein